MSTAIPLSELLVTPVVLQEAPHQWRTPALSDDCGCVEGNPFWSPRCVQAAIEAALAPFRRVLEDWASDQRSDAENLTLAPVEQLLGEIADLVKLARTGGTRDAADLYIEDMTKALADVIGTEQLLEGVSA